MFIAARNKANKPVTTREEKYHTPNQQKKSQSCNQHQTPTQNGRQNYSVLSPCQPEFMFSCIRYYSKVLSIWPFSQSNFRSILLQKKTPKKQKIYLIGARSGKNTKQLHFLAKITAWQKKFSQLKLPTASNRETVIQFNWLLYSCRKTSDILKIIKVSPDSVKDYHSS